MALSASDVCAISRLISLVIVKGYLYDVVGSLQHYVHFK